MPRRAATALVALALLYAALPSASHLLRTRVVENNGELKKSADATEEEWRAGGVRLPDGTLQKCLLDAPDAVMLRSLKPGQIRHFDAPLVVLPVDLADKDVGQGNFGNCFLLATMMSAARLAPESTVLGMMRLDEHDDDRGNKVVMRLFDDDGKPVLIRVDFSFSKKITSNNSKYVKMVTKGYASMLADDGEGPLLDKAGQGGFPRTVYQRLFNTQPTTYKLNYEGGRKLLGTPGRQYDSVKAALDALLQAMMDKGVLTETELRRETRVKKDVFTFLQAGLTSAFKAVRVECVHHTSDDDPQSFAFGDVPWVKHDNIIFVASCGGAANLHPVTPAIMSSVAGMVAEVLTTDDPRGTEMARGSGAYGADGVSKLRQAAGQYEGLPGVFEKVKSCSDDIEGCDDTDVEAFVRDYVLPCDTLFVLHEDETRGGAGHESYADNALKLRDMLTEFRSVLADDPDYSSVAQAVAAVAGVFGLAEERIAKKGSGRSTGDSARGGAAYEENTVDITPVLASPVRLFTREDAIDVTRIALELMRPGAADEALSRPDAALFGLFKDATASGNRGSVYKGGAATYAGSLKKKSSGYGAALAAIKAAISKVKLLGGENAAKYSNAVAAGGALLSKMRDMSAVTGAAFSGRYSDAAERLFAILQGSADLPGVCSSRADPGDRFSKSDMAGGIAMGHAYMFIGTSEEAGIKYVIVKNPWEGHDGNDYKNVEKNLEKGTAHKIRPTERGDVVRVELSLFMHFFDEVNICEMCLENAVMNDRWTRDFFPTFTGTADLATMWDAYENYVSRWRAARDSGSVVEVASLEPAPEPSDDRRPVGESSGGNSGDDTATGASGGPDDEIEAVELP